MAFDYRIVLAAMQMKYSSLKGQGNPRSVNTLDFFFFFNAENGNGVLPVKVFLFFFISFHNKGEKVQTHNFRQIGFFIKP